MSLAKPRSREQILVDKYLLLLSVKESERFGWLKATKIQKVPFYAEYLMNETGEKAFNLLFRRHNFGPYSDDLERDLKELSSVNYVTVEQGNIGLDELGERILSDTKELIEKNRWILRPIVESAKKIAPLNTDEALNFVYALPLKSRWGNTVEDIPDGATIVKPLDEKQATQIFRLNEDELETLDVLLDHATALGVYSLADRLHRGPLMPFVVD